MGLGYEFQSYEYGSLIRRDAGKAIVDGPTALFKSTCSDFPGGAVVKNPPANAGDTGSIPGRGRSHMPWSN